MLLLSKIVTGTYFLELRLKVYLTCLRLHSYFGTLNNNWKEIYRSTPSIFPIDFCGGDLVQFPENCCQL